MTQQNDAVVVGPHVAINQQQLFTYVHRNEGRVAQTVNLANGQTLKIGPKRGAKVGLLLAKKVEKDGKVKVVVGWSLCNRSLDTWNQTEAFKIAENRINGTMERVPTPDSIQKRLKAFMDRCRQYYKTDVVECLDPVAKKKKKKAASKKKVTVTTRTKKVAVKKVTPVE